MSRTYCTYRSIKATLRTDWNKWVFIHQDEDDDILSTEDKATNTVDVLQESFETVQLTENAELEEEPGSGHILLQLHSISKQLSTLSIDNWHQNSWFLTSFHIL